MYVYVNNTLPKQVCSKKCVCDIEYMYIFVGIVFVYTLMNTFIFYMSCYFFVMMIECKGRVYCLGLWRHSSKRIAP